MDEKYPIGKFQFDDPLTSEVIETWIQEIEAFPQLLRDAVCHLSQAQLDTPYRTGGWTIRQVVHHLADSHMNAYIRCKLTVTEENPLIKPYDEAKWADISDYEMPIEGSLSFLETLHARWVYFLRNLSQEEMRRTFRHPETGESTLGRSLGFYAWHGKHHLAHIISLLNRKDW